jgi:hypothetical protein
MSDRLQEIIDRLALRELVEEYARGCDRHEGFNVARLFTEDGRIARYSHGTGDGQPITEHNGRASIASVVDGLGRYDVTTHFLGQQSVSIDGDRGQGETYCLAHHVYNHNGDRHNRVAAIRYLDAYSQQDDRWQFRERRVVLDWIEYRPMGSVNASPSWTREADAATSWARPS